MNSFFLMLLQSLSVVKGKTRAHMVFTKEVRAELKNREGMKTAGKALLNLAIPSAGSTIFVFLPQMITTMFVGQRLTLTQFAAYSAALSTFSVFAMSIAQGLTTALSTLASQAYGRDPESGEVGESSRNGPGW